MSYRDLLYQRVLPTRGQTIMHFEQTIEALSNGEKFRMNWIVWVEVPGVKQRVRTEPYSTTP